MRQMYKVIWMMLVLLAMCQMVGCGDDNDKATSPGPEGELVGTWKLVSVTEEGETMFAADVGLETIITYRADGTWSSTMKMEEETESGEGTYTISGNKLTTTEEGEEPETVTFSISGKTLTVTDEDGAVMTFQKQ